MIEVYHDRSSRAWRVFHPHAPDRSVRLWIRGECRIGNPLIANASQQAHLAIQTIFRARLQQLARSVWIVAGEGRAIDVADDGPEQTGESASADQRLGQAI